MGTSEKSGRGLAQHATICDSETRQHSRAEYQNEPLSARADLPFNLNVENLLQKTNGVKRLAVPEYCEKLTTFIDVQNNVLFFMSVAWELTGRGHVIDYGTFPDQRRIHFSKQQIEKTLQKRFRTDNLNEAIYQGSALSRNYYSRENTSDSTGAVMSMDRVAIDARSGFHTRTVRRFCRESNYVGRIHPTFGQFIGKDSSPVGILATSKRRPARFALSATTTPKKYARRSRDSRRHKFLENDDRRKTRGVAGIRLGDFVF